MNHIDLVSPVVSQQEYEAQKAWGLLVSINLYQCDKEKITNPEVMKEFILKLCQEINMEPHGLPHIEKFAEGHLEGYSLMQFIKTSSITIHFDDKLGDRAFIDVFSCKYFEAQEAGEFCANYFGAQQAKVWSLIRN